MFILLLLGLVYLIRDTLFIFAAALLFTALGAFQFGGTYASMLGAQPTAEVSQWLETDWFSVWEEK